MRIPLLTSVVASLFGELEVTGRGLAGDLLAVGAKRAVLEVKANLESTGRRNGSGIAYGTLEGPSKPGDKSRDSTGECSVAKAGAHHARKLEGTRGVKTTPVGNGDVEGELCLVCRHDGHVRARNERNGTNGGVLHCTTPHQGIDLGRPAEGEVSGKSQALVGCSHKPGAKTRDKRECIGAGQNFKKRRRLLRELNVGNLNRRLGDKGYRHATAGGIAGMYAHMPVEVTVGGATVFVVDVEQFHKY